MRNKFFIVLLFTALIASAPVLAQENLASETSLKSALDADAKSTFTDKNPGAHLIPGTKPNPLAAPDSVPGPAMGKVLLQPGTKMTDHYDHTMHDNASYSKTLIDLLEYRPDGADSDVRWDIERWQGEDYHRWWIKTEGERNIHNGDYDAEFQLLKSELTHPYTEFQYGLRLQTQGHDGTNIARPQAVVGFQSLMPYNYELESALYVDLHGNISASVKAEKDILITQKLILQPRLEADAALQQVERFGVGSGLNNVSLGLRLRYEIRREFAPYIGVTYEKAFGKTASFMRQDGGDTGQWRFVAGVRMWF
jgi:copper resistance protein B